ncbi:hypothetical protein F2Q68_00014893 [Brassica cretica]|uniref:Uncharacterized protein n=1 Tax=Brassica cretica TaxID=69181 RepID=A0A8S9HF84_BRACR|nr:hypothetical protein F2Q68_00014893 [Brassica cretica]
MWADFPACSEGCESAVKRCGGCLGGAGKSGVPLLLIISFVVLGLFTVMGIISKILVANMVDQ